MRAGLADPTRRLVLGAGGAMLAPRARAADEGPGREMLALSRYMAAAAGRPLPPEVVEKAKHHILDTFGAMVSGAELDPGKAAIAFARAYSGRPVASVAGSSVRVGVFEAALANGVLGHADETDDSHGPSQSHPGCAVIPAALAMGEAAGVTGTRFLRAVVLGYDVGTRVTMAMGGVVFRNESHRDTHAIAGGFGAAAAAACVAALDERRMRWVLDYASQQSSGYSVWQRDADHIEKAFVFGGMPARDGATAASLVQAGWTGVDDVFSGADNFFMAHAPKGDPAKLVEALGERYEVMRTDIKKWTVGSPIQAPLDAVHGLIEAHRLKADQVREVVVRLAPTVGAVVDNREMPDVSLQHMVAVMLLDGTASFHAAHDRSRMRDAAVLAQKAKVRLVADPALAARLPLRVAVVEITLVDGRRLENRVEAVRGTAGNPMTRDEVVDKVRDLTEPLLGLAGARRLIAATLDIEGVADVRAVSRLLQPT